jgi:predicted PolB exonuclease-like 3'-5' exonuclease
MWNPSREKRVSLDRLCKILGVPTSKGDMDGSKVAETAAAGEWDKIARYCEGDVIATRACYLKMAAA